MLEKTDGIIAAYPHGDSHKVQVRASKAGALSKDSAAKLIQGDSRFKVTAFETRVLVQKKKKSKPVTKI
jgi:hypothetical protein